jgi:hypothetical protein
VQKYRVYPDQNCKGDRSIMTRLAQAVQIIKGLEAIKGMVEPLVADFIQIEIDYLKEMSKEL